MCRSRVCLFDTNWCSTEAAKCRITQTTPEALNVGGVRLKMANFTNNSLLLKNVDIASAVNLVPSKVYHTECLPLDVLPTACAFIALMCENRNLRLKTEPNRTEFEKSNRPSPNNRYGPKIWGCAPLGKGTWVLCPFGGSNTTWPQPRPTCMPSFILVRPTVWPQYTNVTDRTDRHCVSIGWTVLQTVAQKSVNIPRSYRQEGWLSQTFCTPRHCPA